jgi:hypothetical protein
MHRLKLDVNPGDFAENLTVDQFRSIYGRVGSQRYRQVTDEIESRLDAAPDSRGLTQ